MSTMMVDGRDLWAANAGVDLTGKLFYFVTFDSSGNFIIANEVVPFGIVFEEASLGNPASVQFRGVGKVLLAETLAPGAIVGPGPFGTAIGHATAGVSGGQLIQGGVAGNIVPIKLF
jgi:hypothetical protein